MTRYIDHDFLAVASFAIRNERSLASPPAAFVSTFARQRLADPRARAASLIGEAAVHKFAEDHRNSVSQRPTRREAEAIIQGVMPNLAWASLQAMGDDAVLDLAANLADYVRRTGQRGGEPAATFADRIRVAWAARHKHAA